jgi:hypothetical protein
MNYTIRTQITINAPLSRVWQVFADLAAWGQWNSVCEDCCLLSGQAMAPGTCFTFTLRPYHLPLKVQPAITACEPGREVVWQGQRLGVRAEHRFAFREENGQTTIVSTETFGGPLFFLARLLRLPRKLHQLSEQLLADIKRAAERECS